MQIFVILAGLKKGFSTYVSVLGWLTRGPLEKRAPGYPPGDLKFTKFCNVKLQNVKSQNAKLQNVKCKITKCKM
jgi:hypothetical protein